MKKIVKVIISCVCILAVCSLIFSLSARTGSKSDSDSGSVESILPQGIVDLLARIFDVEEGKEDAFAEEALRVTAHFCEFALLGAVSVLHVSVCSSKNVYIPSGIFGVLYAVSDEVHQIFVPGRTFQFSDIMTDCLGVFGGLLFCLIILAISKKI